MKKIVLAALLHAPFIMFSQARLDKLTIEKIMRDPKWIGSSPSNPSWSEDGTTLYFQWNPDKAPSDSTYYITTTSKTPVKATVAQKQAISGEGNHIYNQARTAAVFSRDGDIIYKDLKTGKEKRINQTVDAEANPQFSFNETKIVYTRSQNLYAWDIAGGETIQLTNVRGSAATTGGSQGGTNPLATGAGRTGGNQQEDWLKNDQLQLFQILKERKEKRELAEAYTKSL